MQIRQYTDDDRKIKKLYMRHYGKELNFDDDKHVWGLYDGTHLAGYSVYYKEISNIKIDWIYAIGYGKIFMKKLEQKFKDDNIKKIYLKVSIDPTENKKIVMRRINFYISLAYKVFDIENRDKYGPLLYMEKKLC